MRASTDQSRIVRSALPLASKLPSGLNATDQISAVCPVRVATHATLATPGLSAACPAPRLAREPPARRDEMSQHLTVGLGSWLPLASSSPSGLNATEATAALCSARVARHVPVVTDQSLIV